MPEIDKRRLLSERVICLVSRNLPDVSAALMISEALRPEECMMVGIFRALAALAMMTALAGCVDHANDPVLLAVGVPVNPPSVAHGICMTDGNAMYNEARKQYQLRAQLTGYAGADELEAETTARAAAHRQYVACLSGQGYRTLYAN
jgi:hypothetical protein